MPRVHSVKKARKAYPNFGIEKGDSYFYWTFRNGGMRKSKTYPKPSQLTQSEYLGQIYSMQEDIPEFTEVSELESYLEETKSTLEMLRDEQEEKRENMPEQLQDTGSGEMLQERYDACDNAINDLECIDVDIDIDEIKEEVKQENDELCDDDLPSEEREQYDAEAIAEKLSEKLSEIRDEIEQALSNLE